MLTARYGNAEILFRGHAAVCDSHWAGHWAHAHGWTRQRDGMCLNESPPRCPVGVHSEWHLLRDQGPGPDNQSSHHEMELLGASPNPGMAQTGLVPVLGIDGNLRRPLDGRNTCFCRLVQISPVCEQAGRLLDESNLELGLFTALKIGTIACEKLPGWFGSLLMSHLGTVRGTRLSVLILGSGFFVDTN